MSTVTPEAPAPPEVGDVPYEITADEFFRLIETGFFPEEARVYLRDGGIYRKMARTNAHSIIGTTFSLALTRRLPPGWLVMVEGQFKLDRRNSPLPDVSVIRGDDPRIYLDQNRRPEAGDSGLAVEIAVTSLAKDLGPNLERYARNGIPNYWVADVMGQRLLVHTGPRVIEGRGEYEHVQTIRAGESFPLILDGREVARFAYEDLMYRTVPPPEPAD